LRSPRKAVILVKAGGPTDAVIDELAAVFEPGDIIIDGGNALWTDTIRRERELTRQGPALHRLRRLRRRGRRAFRPVPDAGWRPCRVG
jgi:6-phosphogluconate dehydrogenase (decarboxylating)